MARLVAAASLFVIINSVSCFVLLVMLLFVIVCAFWSSFNFSVVAVVVTERGLFYVFLGQYRIFYSD